MSKWFFLPRSNLPNSGMFPCKNSPLFWIKGCSLVENQIGYRIACTKRVLLLKVFYHKQLFCGFDIIQIKPRVIPLPVFPLQSDLIKRRQIRSRYGHRSGQHLVNLRFFLCGDSLTRGKNPRITAVMPLLPRHRRALQPAGTTGWLR